MPKPRNLPVTIFVNTTREVKDLIEALAREFNVEPPDLAGYLLDAGLNGFRFLRASHEDQQLDELSLKSWEVIFATTDRPAHWSVPPDSGK